MRQLLACLVFLSSTAAQAQAVSPILVKDDLGHTVRLAAPAKRIVSLAPHTTELLFAAGAGGQVLGVSAFSDFPAQAQQLASIGSSTQLDIERIVALKPDLIIAWKSGNNAKQIAQLRALGIPVFESEPHTLEDIATSLSRLGELAGTPQGSQAANDFRKQQQALRVRYANRTPVRVFYQIWPSPLMTLNDRHIVADALSLCGAQNIFGSLPQLAPTVSREAVLAAQPEAIFASDERAETWDRWKAWPQLPAVRLGNLYRVDGSIMNRAGPRMLDATEGLCRQIQEARQRLATAAAPAPALNSKPPPRKGTP